MSSKPSTTQAVKAILAAIERVEGPMPPKKRLIVEAAILCISETGYAACSTRMIANRAGVAEATIFRHFSTKKDLLLRITEPVIEGNLVPAVAVEVEQILARTGPDLRSFVRAILLSRLAFADSYAPFVRIILQELLVNSDLRAVVINHAAQAFAEIIPENFAIFQTQGQISNVPPERFLRIIISVLLGYYIHRSLIAPGNWDDEVEVDGMLDVVLQGVTPD